MKSSVVLAWAWVFGAASVCLTGCGSDLPKTIKVTGKVTFNGQQPPGPGIVYFLPQSAAEGFPLRPGTADFDATGAYTTTTFEPGDGLMPGSYKIYIECWETAPNMEGKPTKSFVPKKFQSAETSGFALEVTTKDRGLEKDFDVVTK
jgi:hypothetical protein